MIVETSECEHFWSIPDKSGVVECLWCGATMDAKAIRRNAYIRQSLERDRNSGEVMFAKQRKEREAKSGRKAKRV